MAGREIITSNPVLYDIEIDLVVCLDTWDDVTDVVDHDKIIQSIERLIY